MHEECLQGPERERERERHQTHCSENPLSTTHVPPLRKVGDVQFTKINTMGRNERADMVFSLLCASVVAHGHISMQGAITFDAEIIQEHQIVHDFMTYL